MNENGYFLVGLYLGYALCLYVRPVAARLWLKLNEKLDEWADV